MKKRVKAVLLNTLVTFLLLEVLARLYMLFVFNTSFFKPADFIYKYYPELKKVSDYKYDKNKINILVLGGSVVYDKPVDLFLPNDTIQVRLCSFPDLLPTNKYNVLSMSNIAHNSLDSRYKYGLLKDVRFDYVFLYHGINDTRANNIRSEKFDKDYRHIEFYDDLYILKRHTKVNYYASILFFDWIIHSIKKKSKEYIDKENFSHQFAFENSNSNFLHGNKIKSVNTFKSNYLAIVDRASEKGEVVIMPSFAFHLDKNYTYEKFKNKELDYDQQLFPIELYGLPANVKNGINAHNSVIKAIADKNKEYVIYFDFNSLVPKNKLYFDDICHLNQTGCQLLANEVMEITSQYNKIP